MKEPSEVIKTRGPSETTEKEAKWGRTFFGTILREDIARYPLFKWK